MEGNQKVNPDIANIPIRDIHLPGDVSWWPLAPGWWITIGLFALAAVAVYFLRLSQQRKQLAKQSMEEFSSLVEKYKKDSDAKSLVAGVSELLRRVSVMQFSDETIAGLTGNAWLEFLDQGLSSKNADQSLLFQSEVGEYLISIQYQKDESIERQKLDKLLILSKCWLQSACKKKPEENTNAASRMRGVA